MLLSETGCGGTLARSSAFLEARSGRFPANEFKAFGRFTDEGHAREPGLSISQGTPRPFSSNTGGRCQGRARNDAGLPSGFDFRSILHWLHLLPLLPATPKTNRTIYKPLPQSNLQERCIKYLRTSLLIRRSKISCYTVESNLPADRGGPSH